MVAEASAPAPRLSLVPPLPARTRRAPLSPEAHAARAAHCRRIASLGGQATVKARGTSWMSEIGKLGFQAALDLGYGEYLLTKLAPSYRAKFGTEPTLGRNTAGDTARAQARRATPTLGVCQWPECTAPATERHHVDGWKVSADTTGLCTAHHDAFDRAYRATRKVWRPLTADPVTPRAVALSIGIAWIRASPSNRR
jgi:hypothetical protein